MTMMQKPEKQPVQTYYGRPALKPAPFETSVVGGYIFLAGLSGAAQLISALAGRRTQGGVVRRGRYLSMLAPTVGSALLIYDLHTPQRFYNMLRIARRTSPMSIGTWILMSFSAFSSVTAGLQFLADRLRPRFARKVERTASVMQAPAAVAGAGLATYTAALLSATSTPLWSAAPRALAVMFGSSSMAAASAALGMAERHNGDRRTARRLDTLMLTASLVELGASAVAHERWDREGFASAHDAAPRSQAVAYAGAVLPFALHAVGGLLGGRAGRILANAASLSVLAGSFCLRTSVMEAGDESARRPEESLRFNKARSSTT